MNMASFRTNAKAILAIACLAGVTGCGGGGGGAQASGTGPAGAPVLSANPITLGSADTVGRPFWPDGSTATGGNGAPVDGVNCLVNEDYHIHAHLAIIQNGEMLAVPASVGLQGCAYELHTHDRSGVIHIETSASRQFTLGQLFAVWGQPLTTTNVAGITGQPVALFINDGNSLVEYKGDIGAIELTNHRAITIQIGTPLKEIPSYKWQGL
jgi:hypothetical protein